MKLNFAPGSHPNQPDPYIFETNGAYYLYCTAMDGVQAFTAPSPFAQWQDVGIVCTVEGCREYWAPCIIALDGWYYLYFSCTDGVLPQCLYAARSHSPLGPFTDARRLFDQFTIDPHVVHTKAGLFLFYAEDNRKPERIGTRIFVDRLTAPDQPANQPVELVVPTFEQELFRHNHFGDGRDWYTLEGPFWLKVDGWQYLMYSGGCFENSSYHIGYASAHTDEPNLTKVRFEKHTANGRFDPLLIQNEFEEGTGHHSVLCHQGAYYAVYHGRDLTDGDGERRTARICRLHFRDGVITAERYPDHI